MAFLKQAVGRPHHAYVLAGPEGCGKQIAARAFAAALLCEKGGCGECRACRLALQDKHPNEFMVEPEGRDIHVETVRAEVWHPVFRTAPEPGRKIFVIREADRLNPAAADVLLKVLGGTAGRRRVAAAFGSASRASRYRALALSRRDLPSARGGVRRRHARRRGRRADARAAHGPACGRQPRPGAATGDRSRRARVPRRRRSSARARDERTVRRARRRRCRSRSRRRVPEESQGRSRCRSWRRSWTNAAGPRTPTAARSAGSRSGTSAGSSAPSATTSTGCCYRCRRCCGTASPRRSAEGRIS